MHQLENLKTNILTWGAFNKYNEILPQLQEFEIISIFHQRFYQVYKEANRKINMKS